MKKCLSIALCLGLVFTMLFMFTGCNEQKKFVGKWESEIDMTDFFNEGMGLDDEMAEYVAIEDFEIVMQLIFNSDGTYKRTVDENSLEDTLEDAKEDLKDGMMDYFKAYLKESGLNMTVDELLEASEVDLDELVEEALGKKVMDEMVDSMTDEGNFEVKDGKLFMSDGLDYEIDEEVYETYELNGDELKLIESVGGDDEDLKDFADELYPMVFERVN